MVFCYNCGKKADKEIFCLDCGIKIINTQDEQIQIKQVLQFQSTETQEKIANVELIGTHKKQEQHEKILYQNITVSQIIFVKETEIKKWLGEKIGPYLKFFPYQILLEITAALLITGILIFATNYSVHLGPQYDSMNPPSHLVPEWYFMPIYMIIKTEGLGEPLFGLMVLTGIIVGLMLMPFLDKGKSRHPLERPKSTITGIFLAGELSALWYLGEKVAPDEISALVLGLITFEILIIVIIFTYITRKIYFKHRKLEEK